MDHLWINGKFQNTTDRKGQPKPVTLPYDGNIDTGIMDTMLMQDGHLHDSRKHFDRLRRHLEHIGMEYRSNFRDESEQAFRYILEAEEIAGRDPKRAFRANVIVVRATKKRIYHVVKMAPYAPMPQDRDLRLCFDRAGRINPNDIRFQIKHVDRSPYEAAMAHAQKAGADLAVMTNTAGRVACVDRGNIFAKINRRWVTPPLEEGVIDGITRAQFMAENTVEERPLTTEELAARASDIRVTNSLMGQRKARLVCG